MVEGPRACRNCGEDFVPGRFDLKRRTCRPCQVVLSRLRTTRRARRRKRDYPRPAVRRWSQARRPALFELCAVCGTKDAHMHADHIVPAGLLRYLAHCDMPPIYENSEDPRNLIGICAACHGRKTPAEVALCAGKPMVFWRRLERLDWPMDKVRLALALYGLDAGTGKAGF